MAKSRLKPQFHFGWNSAAAALALAMAMPAMAQDIAGAGGKKDVFDGDYVIVGAGVLSQPSYAGSDDESIIPALGATGEVSGINFTIRGPSLSLDLIPDKPGSDVGFRFGPQVRLRTNRSGNVRDDVVALLGELDKVIEAGFRVGVGIDDLLTNTDSLSAGVSFRWDVSGKGSGMVVTPAATYLLPVSRALALGAMASVKIVDDNFADYNFSVSPAGAAASGLAPFDAKGGLIEADIGIAVARDFNGNFLDGGFSIGAGVLYSRLFGSAASSPITSIRGSRNQWAFGTGLGYIF